MFEGWKVLVNGVNGGSMADKENLKEANLKIKTNRSMNDLNSYQWLWVSFVEIKLWIVSLEFE